MGQSNAYHCKNCDLDAVVSGGDDRGFYIATRTMFCAQCKALYDVLLGNTNDSSHPIPESRRVSPEAVGKCPKCRGAELTPWRSGEPCPRCGGALEKDVFGPGKLWD